MSVQLLESCDDWATLRNALRGIATDKNEWAGIPIPVDGERLVIEPSYQFAALSEMGETEEVDDVKVRNVWFSQRLGCRMAICEQPAGKFWASPLAGSANSATALLRTLGVSDAWGIEQEAKAIQLLGTLVSHRKFKQYMLTGSFLESSKASGVTYLFRRLRPTLAIRGSRILAGLCMHPVGYYEESWAGCMCPTDDLVSHLMLMRGDEHMFWRRCNQHPAHDPACGI